MTRPEPPPPAQTCTTRLSCTATSSGLGVQPGRLGTLGPLAHLLVAKGKWRVDGPARLRRLLRDLVEIYRADALQDLPSEQVEHHCKAVDWSLGLSRFPLSREEAGARSGPTPAGEGTVRLWERRVFERAACSTRGTEFLSALVEAAPSTAELPRAPSSPWSSLEEAPRDWPPQEARNELLVRLTSALENHLHVESGLPRANPAQLPPLSDDRLLAAARQLALRDAERYLSDRDGGCKARLFLRHEIAGPWHREGYLSMWDPSDAVPGTPVPARTRFREIAAAALQAAFGDLLSASGTRSVFDAVIARHLRMYVEQLAHLMTETDSVRQVEFPTALARLLRTPEPPHARLSAASKGLEASLRSPERNGDPVRDCNLLESLARASRESSGDERCEHIQRYIEIRRHMDLSRLAQWRRDHVELADHSIDWDLVSVTNHSRGSALRGAFDQSRAYNHTPDDLHPGLRTHRLRSRSVTASKREIWHEALRFGDRALVELWQRETAGDLTDDAEAIEAREQTMLAMAGLWTRLSERVLLTDERTKLPHSVAHFVRNALWYSACAVGELTLIQQRHGLGVGDHRFDTGRISHDRWTVQPQFVSCRAHLVACTAVAAGLCSTQDLTERTGHQPPAVPADLTSLDEAYLNLLRNKRLVYGNRGQILQLALWTALLHPDLRLPVLEDPREAARELDDLEFLHCHPNRPALTVKLDLLAITDSLKRHNYDASIIGRLPVTSPVYRALQHLNPEFAGWQADWRMKSH